MDLPDPPVIQHAGALRRRQFAALLAAACSGGAHAAALGPHAPFGALRLPRPIPALKVRTHLDQVTDLGTLTKGRFTAMHLMFTGCSALCPIQGALFAQLQQLLHQRRMAVQLLSVSIDPLGDGPTQLTRWLHRFDARPGWLAVAPQVADVQSLVQVLVGGADSPRETADVHSAQVFVADRSGSLCYRSPDMPAAETLADTLVQLAREG